MHIIYIYIYIFIIYIFIYILFYICILYLYLIYIYIYTHTHTHKWGFPGGTVVKNSPANARDIGSIPGWGRSPEEEMATHSSILAWKIPWTEEPGGLQSDITE